MITAGIDIGSRTIKVVLLCDSGLLESIVVNAGATPNENAARAFHAALEAADLRREDVSRLVATGYGRNYFQGADAVSSEILCHARGVSHILPTARTVIDIGGQDSKLIALDAAGRVTNFVMNDRCAAGTGRFIEMVAAALEVSVEEMGTVAAGASEPCEISSMCAVFAESEIIGLLQRGTPVDAVVKGVCRAVARRTLTMSGKVPLAEDVIFTGGVAKNDAVRKALQREADLRLHIPSNPQLTGALGAALIANDRKDRGSRSN